MATIFIDPSFLDADAVVPQACDNQFVNESLFRKIARRKTNFSDSKIREEKRQIVHGELVRSLIYGSQTVINRAYLHNNYGVYHNFEAFDGNSANAQAFSKLLQDRAIIPFLYKERELSIEQLEEEQRFTKDPRGIAALQNLLEITTGDVTVTGFPAGHQNLPLLGQEFREYICKLKRLDPELAKIMCDELFPGEKTDDVFAPFLTKIKDFGRWADSYLDTHGELSREIIYANHFVEPKSNVSDGCLREMGDLGLQFAIKKLVDLKYNSNMPDAIGRYVFTPHTMPTRSALVDDFQIGKIKSNDVEDLIANKLSGEFARRFHAESSKWMYLPFLGELTMQDVGDIRGLSSRKPFISQQKKILEEPLAITKNLPAYQDAFEAFQQELSNWYVKKYKRDPMERRFQNFATVGVRFGGRILIYGLTGELEVVDDVIETAFGQAAWTMAQGKVQGVAVKLMLKVYDHVNKRFDENLSFNIEMMRTETSYTADEINNLVEKIKQQSLLLREHTISAEADTN